MLGIQRSWIHSSLSDVEGIIPGGVGLDSLRGLLARPIGAGPEGECELGVWERADGGVRDGAAEAVLDCL
jgi:hypothetical protein